MDSLYSSFGTLHGAFETIAKDFSEHEQDQPFRANAERWYRI